MKMLLIALMLICMATPVWAEDIDFDTIAMIESSNNPLAYNQSSGARGLFQITKICLDDYNLWHSKHHYTQAELFDPAINKHIAIWYLTERIPQMLRHNKKEVNIQSIIICYNFGIGNFLKWNKDTETLPIETKNYLNRYNWYKK